MTSPTLLKLVSVGTLVIDRAGFWVPGVVASAHLLAAPAPTASSTHDLVKNEPALRSAWTIVWLAVQVMGAPGARSVTGVVGEHRRSLKLGSVTTRL